MRNFYDNMIIPKNTFIRFKDIPDDEFSSVHDGDAGIIRKEVGVSCYACIRDRNIYRIILPSVDKGPLFDLEVFIDDSRENNTPIYLVKGDIVGIGTYGEPVIKNVKILFKLKLLEFSNPKPKYKLDRTNIQFIRE